MSIRVKCQKCGKNIEAKDAMAGKKAQCPNCASVIEFPIDVQDLPDDWLDDPVPEKARTRVVPDYPQPETYRLLQQQESARRVEGTTQLRKI
jgi:hypothetical protein